MHKYPIRKELFPFNHFAPPISEKFLRLAEKHMGVPGKFLKAKGFSITKHQVKSFDGEMVPFYTIFPEKVNGEAPYIL